MTPEDVLKLLNAGGLLAGTILIIWSGLKEKWVPGATLKRETLRADKAEADRDRATKVIEDQLIPLVIRITKASENLENRKTSDG